MKRTDRFILAVLGLLPALGACNSPYAANIELRKQNQELRDQLKAAEIARQGDQASIAQFEGRAGTVDRLAEARMLRLYTVHGLRLGRLTRGDDADPARGGDEGLKIQATPTDQQEQPLKAAGRFKVEAFDLAATPTLIGTWNFDLEQSRAAWNGAGLLYCYLLRCPWQTPPTRPDLTLKVTFVDELTGRSFSEQTVVRVKPPASGN